MSGPIAISRRSVLAILAAGLLAGCAHGPRAKQGPIQRLYVFGDSYSDIGYGFQDGNGPTAVAYLAERLGLPLSHPRAADWRGKSLDFARSGAPTGGQASPVMQKYSVVGQARIFAEMVAAGDIAFDPAQALFFIAGGLNDSPLSTAQTEANLRETVSILKAAGARRFRIAQLPEKIPDFSAVGVRLNPMLERLPATLRRDLGVDVRPSRWGAYFDEVMGKAPALGIVNTTDPCASRRAAELANRCRTPDQYFYYHPGHPSTAVHRLVGERLYRELMQ